MRTIILIIFTVMCLGTCVAQETIHINGNDYEVVNRDFDHVWGPDVPFRIQSVNSSLSNIIIDTYISPEELENIKWHYRPSLIAPRNELPLLRYYTNGGFQHRVSANNNQTNTALIPLGIQSHLTMQWIYPTESISYDLVTGEELSRHTHLIGPEFFKENN